ncbi:T9SS type A sorting domain-containing protein [candidate division KSB1 bacterium]|nr:T9SS type A sorting domain-containing protein [candidate division KSB1 bacterium]
MQTKTWIFIIILIGFIFQFACGQDLVPEFQFVYDDSVRSYYVYEPELEPNPDGYPLVIGFHGGGTTLKGLSFIGTAFLIPKAKTEKFIVACPNSYTLFWNAGSGYEMMCHGIDDVGFVSAVIDSMIKNYNIDTSRIYLMGHSNGSMMAYRMAAELSDRIAGLAVNSGQMVYEYFNPTSPVPILHFHGLEDDKCAYDGASNEDSMLVIPPVETVMEMWRGANNCSAKPDTILNQNGILGRKWSALSGYGDVILYRIENWGHSWPRSNDPGINATDVMWDFLKVQLKNTTTNLEAKQFMYDGKMRTYLVYDPPANLGARSLLIGLHCHTGTAAGLLTYTDLLQKVKDENVIGVFPNALMQPIGTAWNVGSSFEQFTLETDDVGFISALIDTMIKNYNVDTTRIYATGHSNGSMMSYRLAAELSDRIAAIGCVAAPMLYEFPNPEFSVPIIHFHGLSDTTCPYEGIVKPHVTIPPVDSCMATWRELNGCSETPEIIMDENGIIGKKWPSSDGKGDIILYTIESCMHDWPVEEKYGISATDVIWDFMKLHTRSRNITNVKKDDHHSIPKNFKLSQNYPNPFNPSTTLQYQLPTHQHVRLDVYNVIGQVIRTLVNAQQDAGAYTVHWDGCDNVRNIVASGIYLIRIQAGNFIATKKMVFLQ